MPSVAPAQDQRGQHLLLAGKVLPEGVEQGGRVRNKLRDGVEEALTIIGTGLLRQSDNTELRERVQSGRLTAAELHRQMLRPVYRLLFLMVVEERHMIVPESPQAERRQRLYDRYYSVGRLRNWRRKRLNRVPFATCGLGFSGPLRSSRTPTTQMPLAPRRSRDLFGPLAIRDIQNTSLLNDDLISRHPALVIVPRR